MKRKTNVQAHETGEAPRCDRCGGFLSDRDRVTYRNLCEDCWCAGTDERLRADRRTSKPIPRLTAGEVSRITNQLPRRL